MDIIQIENKAGQVKLNDVVHQPVMERLIDEIGKIFGANAAETGQYSGELTNCFENAVDTLDIEIHSPGGSVLDGYLLYSEIKKMQARGVYVTATINSLAASMASVIAMAADKVRMVPNGRMMIHDVQSGLHGNADAMKKQAAIMDEMSSEIADIYAAKTGKTNAEMRKLMKAETWLSAKTALADGFIDEIYDPAASKNSIDIDSAIPTGLHMKFLDRLTSPSDTEAQEQIIALNAQISQHDQTVQEYEAKLAIAETALAEAQTLKIENVALTEKVATIPTLEARIVELTAANVVTEEKISLAAAQKLAAQGHGEVIDLGKGNVTDQAENTKTRAEFHNLKPTERTAFLKSGGKLTD